VPSKKKPRREAGAKDGADWKVLSLFRKKATAKNSLCGGMPSGRYSFPLIATAFGFRRRITGRIPEPFDHQKRTHECGIDRLTGIVPQKSYRTYLQIVNSFCCVEAIEEDTEK
jgi:hypothetical protein